MAKRTQKEIIADIIEAGRKGKAKTLQKLSEESGLSSDEIMAYYIQGSRQSLTLEKLNKQMKREIEDDK